MGKRGKMVKENNSSAKQVRSVQDWLCS